MQEREPRRVDRRPVAVGVDLGARVAEPAVAVGDHGRVGDDRLRGLDDRGVEQTARLAVLDEDHADVVADAGARGEIAPVVGRDRPRS